VEEMSDDELVEISDKSSGDEVQVGADGSRTDMNATAAEGKLEILKGAAESPQEPELRSAVALESVTVKPEIAPSLANEKQSLVQTLANFWADRSATGWGPLKYPLSHSEHMFSDSDIIIREDEPSSLIAFCLSSKDYLDRVNDQKMKDETSKASSGLANFKGDSDLEKRMLKKTALHLRYQFQESSARFSCKVFYSEQFDAIRKFCDCDEYYIQSLARCAKWESNGGKSGSAFLKTLDDRLVMKELSPIELEAFVKFAPSYFEYMAEAFFHELPTVLAKILGLYSVQIRNPLTGNVMKLDVIVMENLFYNRKMSRIFDLKGSMRNRHVQQTGREDEVLLDENMVEYIYESPLFTRDHAKRFLKTSLFNDTLFLAKMNVMDYSLVIGLDKENKQLVVGIIGKQPCVQIPLLVCSLAN
jgi:1-phosphatidylinositol-3-phosphate 5-kinase